MKTQVPENLLVIYSAAEKQYCNKLLDGFRDRYPSVTIDFRFGISVALHEQYLATLAAGKPEVDLIWNSAMDLQMGLVATGHALPYFSAEAGTLPDGTVYNNLAYSTTLEPLVTLINKEHFDARVPAGSLAEITAVLNSDRDRLHGKLACYDIERNGLGFLALMHESRRDTDFNAFMKVLADYKPKVFGSNPTLLAEVESGRAALCFHVLGSYALRAIKSNPKLAIAVSKVPPLAVSRVALIPTSAPHPNAAKLFMDYLLSRDGQLQLLKEGLFPIRSDVISDDHNSANVVTSIRIDEGLGDLLNPQRRRELMERWQRCMR